MHEQKVSDFYVLFFLDVFVQVCFAFNAISWSQVRQFWQLFLSGVGGGNSNAKLTVNNFTEEQECAIFPVDKFVLSTSAKKKIAWLKVNKNILRKNLTLFLL